MSDATAPTVGAAPRIGFVSLGCPKALTDSELILTQLAAEGYVTSKTARDADLVIVNTCGFIDDAVKESLDAIGEALADNGKVIVTGCLGAREGAQGDNFVKSMHPKVLAVTGPHDTPAVMDAVHTHLPKPHDPFIDLVPANRIEGVGIKLTPRHYAYLKISEGCNHRCTFCIIPSMRGDLVSRPVGDVLGEAKRLFDGGVKELLIVSQDTSAYGVDIKYRTGFFDGRPVKSNMLSLCEELARIAQPYGAWVRLHYVYPYPHVDDVLPLLASGAILPYLDIPLQHAHPDVLKRMKRPASGERHLERIAKWREACPQLVIRSTFIAGFPGETEAEFQVAARLRRSRRHRPRGLLRVFAGRRRRGECAGRSGARRPARRTPRPLHGRGRTCLDRTADAPRRLDDAGAGRPRACDGPTGRGGAHLRRRARNRRPRAPAGATENQHTDPRGYVRASARRGH